MEKRAFFKQKLGRISAVLSAVLFMILSLDLLEKGFVGLGISIGAVGIINLVVLKRLKNNASLYQLITNALNATAAMLLAIQQYQGGGRFYLWIAITLAYAIVTVMFIRKYSVEK